MMDVRDLALQTACPAIAAPRFGPLPNMANGQRIILAANGVFVQVKLDWLDCIQRLSHALPIPLPYGGIEERLTFTFGVLPIRLIEAFIEAARRGLPNEVAGALIYSLRNQSLQLALCRRTRSITGCQRWMPTRRWPWTCIPMATADRFGRPRTTATIRASRWPACSAVCTSPSRKPCSAWWSTAGSALCPIRGRPTPTRRVTWGLTLSPACCAGY